MASHIRRLIINTRERLLSTDFNDAAALQHRALTEGLAAATQGDVAQHGVLRGLTVSIPGGSLSVNVAAGLATRLGAAATPYDSSITWIELRTGAVVDLSSYVDGANPRWLCIELEAADVAEVTSLRDIFNPGIGTFTPVNVDKVRGSAPVVRVTAGAAAATPQLPAGVAGRIPLAYVYIPAAAATLTVGDVVHCRPIVRPGNTDVWDNGVRDVRGGGVSVATDGTTIALRQCRGRFDLHTIPFSVGSGTLAIAAAGWDGGSAPGADDVGYFYAIPAPFPAGYDATLAPREFRPEASAATRFPSMVSAGTFGCIVVASTSEPDTTTAQGAPSSGNFSLTAAPWGGAASVPRSRGVYLGAAFYDQSSAVFRNQLCVGDSVTPRVLDSAAPANPQTRLHNATVWVANGTDINVWNSAASGAGGTVDNCQFPITAFEVEVVILAATATATSFTVFLGDQSHPLGFGVTQSHEVTWSGTNAAGSAAFELHLRPNAAGVVEFISGLVTPTQTDLGELWMYSRRYRDAVLARR